MTRSLEVKSSAEDFSFLISFISSGYHIIKWMTTIKLLLLVWYEIPSQTLKKTKTNLQTNHKIKISSPRMFNNVRIRSGHKKSW